MTNETKHTPTPWKLDEIGDVFIGDKCVAVILDDDDDFSNGNHIVKCVNMHDELVDKMENILIAIGMGWDLEGVAEEAAETLKKAGAL